MNENTRLRRHPRLIYVLAGIGLYAVFLIATAPANVMGWMLPRLTNNRILLSQPEGGFWHGKSQALLLKADSGEVKSIGDVQWDFLFLPLFKLQLAARVEVFDGRNTSRGILAAGLGQIHLRQMNAILPIPLITEFNPAWKIWKPTGELKFNSNQFSIGKSGLRGTAELEWRNASVGLSQVKPLGSYRLHIQDEQKVAKMDLSTLSGVLQLAGKGEWSKDNGLNFRGTAQADPSQKAALQDLLRLLGSEQGNGVYQISISQKQLKK